MYKRIFVVVCDSMGIGEAPDAYLFNDSGSNTLKSCSKSKYFDVETLKKLGIFNIVNIGFESKYKEPIGSFGKLREVSMGKDTVTGHWEMMGTILEKPFPTFPDGFPDNIIKEYEKKTGRKVIVNKPYSGTEVIKDYGKQHMETGDLIVYTSADSVFQVAAHNDIVPLDELYKDCVIAREMLVDEYGVGRVIARPFNGEYPFTRTEDRKDYALNPPYNALNYLKDNKYDVIAIGKIKEIFNDSGQTSIIKSTNNETGMKCLDEVVKKDFTGLCFTNLEDFDMLYGHRNNVDGYAEAITIFDKWLDRFITKLKKDDLLIITADHGNDPATPSTDHSREYTPLLVYNKNLKSVDLGIRSTYADIGKTILDNYNIENDLPGTSFLKELKDE